MGKLELEKRDTNKSNITEVVDYGLSEVLKKYTENL